MPPAFSDSTADSSVYPATQSYSELKTRMILQTEKFRIWIVEFGRVFYGKLWAVLTNIMKIILGYLQGRCLAFTIFLYNLLHYLTLHLF